MNILELLEYFKLMKNDHGIESMYLATGQSSELVSQLEELITRVKQEDSK